MKNSLMLAALALLIAGGAAEAATKILASGPVYGGNAPGFIMSCRLFNAGTGPVTVTARQIVLSSNAPALITVNSCTGTLGASKHCLFAGSLAVNQAFACRAVVSGTNPVVRGTAQLSSGNTILASEQMQ